MLDGGLGGDLLTGNSGADRFAFVSIFDSAPGARDRIADFHPGEGDVIDLSRIDANVGTAGDQAFVFMGGFPGQAGRQC